MRTLPFALLIIVLLCGAEPLPSPTRTVRDEAKILSAETKEKAQQRLDAISERFKLNVLIDTVPQAPDGLRARLKNLSASRVTALMKSWAQERAALAELDGIYVLICMDPKDIRVVDWPKDKAYFSERECDALRRPFLERKVNVDKAVLSLLDKLEAKLNQLFPSETAGFAVNGGLVLVGIILGILLLWIVLGLILSRLERKSEKRYQGLMPGVLGGMFGTVAGYWIYDKFLAEKAAELPSPEAEMPTSLQDTMKEQVPS